ncbi:MAG: 30S ribosome-binding factor RbfA [Christensenellales bacterium]
MKFRMERINLEIKNNLSEIISNMNNSKLSNQFVTIAEVETSPDLYSSKVSISCLSDNKNCKEIVEALNSSKGYIKRELAKKIKIKRIPDIYFVEDYFEQHAQRIDDLLKQINDN